MSSRIRASGCPSPEYEIIELKRSIDDFLETLPLVQALAVHALAPLARADGRDGAHAQRVVGRVQAGNLLEADLLEFDEDVEDITNSALNWSRRIAHDLGAGPIRSSRSSFKSAGRSAQGGETAELMEGSRRRR